MADPFTVPNPNLGLPATTPRDNRSLVQSIIDYINERTDISGSLMSIPNFPSNIVRSVAGLPSPSYTSNSSRGVAGKRGEPTVPLAIGEGIANILGSVAPLRTGGAAIPAHRFHSMPGLAERNILGPRGNLGSGFGELNPRTAMRGEIPVGGARGGYESRIPTVDETLEVINREFPNLRTSVRSASSGTRYLTAEERQRNLPLAEPSSTEVIREPYYRVRFTRAPHPPTFTPGLDREYLAGRFMDTSGRQNPFLRADVARDIHGNPLSDRQTFLAELRRRLSGEPFDPLRPTQQPQEPITNQLELPLKGPGRISLSQMQQQLNRLNDVHLNIVRTTRPLIDYLRANPNSPNAERILSRINSASDILKTIQQQMIALNSQYTLAIGSHRPHSFPRNAEMTALSSRYNVGESSGYLNPSTRPLGGGDTTFGTFLGQTIRPRHKGPGRPRTNIPITEAEMRAYLVQLNAQEARPGMPEPFIWQQTPMPVTPPPITRRPYGHGVESASRGEIIANRMRSAVLRGNRTREAMEDPAVREYIERALARRRR